MKMTKFLTFDSNSTSDESDVLKCKKNKIPPKYPPCIFFDVLNSSCYKFILSSYWIYKCFTQNYVFAIKLVRFDKSMLEK